MNILQHIVDQLISEPGKELQNLTWFIIAFTVTFVLALLVADLLGY